MIPVHQLAQIRALAEHGSFRGAARALGIAQPTLSRSIRALECQLDVVLFDRGRGGVKPTSIGRLVLERGSRVLLESRELVREVRLHRGVEVGTLAISTALFPAALCVHRAVGRLMAQHPRLDCVVNLRSWRQAIDDVLTRRVDIGMGELSVAEGHPQLDVAPVGRHPLVFMCRVGHPILTRERVTTADVFAYPWASTRGPARIVAHFPKPPFAAGRIDPANGDFVPAVQIDDLAAGEQVAAESDCLAPNTPSRLRRHLPTVKLVQVDYSSPWMQLNYGFITLRARTASPVAEAFMAEVRTIEREIAAP